MKLLAFWYSSVHTQYIEQGIRFRKQCKLKTSLDAILATEANLSKSLIYKEIREHQNQRRVRVGYSRYKCQRKENCDEFYNG